MSSKRRLRRECERKIAYRTLEAAIAAKRRQKLRVEPGARLHAYRCPRCGKFHVGNTPGRIRQAIAAKEAMTA